jgi:hypothetical protein
MEDDPPLFAALAVSRFVEDHTGWSIRKFVHTARRHRTVHIRTGNHCSLPKTRSPATHIRRSCAAVGRGAHQFEPGRVTR